MGCLALLCIGRDKFDNGSRLLSSKSKQGASEHDSPPDSGRAADDEATFVKDIIAVLHSSKSASVRRELGSTRLGRQGRGS
jgi:hypothetical protein